MTIYSLTREAESVLSSAPEHLQDSAPARALRAALQRLDDLSQVFVDAASRYEASRRVHSTLAAFRSSLNSRAEAQPLVRIFA